MSTYGISRYGKPNGVSTLYGLARPVTVVPGGGPLPPINNAYLIDPFTATPIDYDSVLLTWSGPDPSTGTPMTEFRLLSSRYGFPVDENDGNVLFDTTGAPGSQYVDQAVVPGEITYYGFYISTGTAWVRAGFTAVLMPVDHGYAGTLFSSLPEYFRDTQDSELTADNPYNSTLQQWLAVAGWSLDYLKTQYDLLFNYQNDPMKMSFADLEQLAGQLGVPVTAEIPAYAVRKAVGNWATVMRERGSLQGVYDHIDLLSGFGADVQLSRNIMLENDQSLPLSPTFAPFDPGIPYRAGEIVSWPVYPEWVVSQPYIVDNYVVYNGVNYQCTATGGQGVPPAGAVDSTTYWAIADGPFLYACIEAVTVLPGEPPPAVPAAGVTPNQSNNTWQIVYDADATESYLAIAGLSGGLNTWEVLQASPGSITPITEVSGLPYFIAANSLTQGIGVHNPSNFSNDYSSNTIRVYNRTGNTLDAWLRSLSRQPSDVAAGSAVPDPQLVIEHGIPVPQTSAATSEWSVSTRYGTGGVVLYGGLNYLALRASTGATPPAPGAPLNQNVDFETGVLPWTAINSATIAQSSAYAYHGTHSVSITPQGVTANPGIQSEVIPVTPLGTYTATAWASLPGGFSGNFNVTLNWLDAAGQALTPTAGTNVNFAGTTSWKQMAVTGQAPANAASVKFAVAFSGTPPQTHVAYFDMALLTCTATPEWLPLGTDSRIPLMVSAQTSQNWSEVTVEQFSIYPFVEWYDNWGNLITRVFARTPTPGTAGRPASYTYDGFAAAVGTALAGKETDTDDQVWTVPAGSWKLDGHGNAYPAGGAASIALVTSAVSATQAVTFTQAPQSGMDTGLVFWYQSATEYWHAGTHGLWYNSGGTWTEAAAYAEPFAPGDRIYVVTNQATASAAVYKNSLTSTPVADASGIQVAAPATPTLTTATTGGTVPAGQYQAEVTYVTASGESLPSAFGVVVVSGTTSTLTVPSPPAATGATGWYAYVTQPNFSAYYRQQAAGSPTAIGTNLRLTALPTTTGPQPPTSDTSGTLPAAVIPGSGATVYSGIASEAV